MSRCDWAMTDDALMVRYHDEEYGRKKTDDNALFEKLCLEVFQAGLSWRTVLYKREAFRECFFGFNVAKAAAMTAQDIERLMNDKRIIRNRRKIEAVIHNARRHLAYFRQRGSFAEYVYTFLEPEALMCDLKSKGYRFIGGVICESFLLSVGAVSAHEPQCFLYKELS